MACPFNIFGRVFGFIFIVTLEVSHGSLRPMEMVELTIAQASVSSIKDLGTEFCIPGHDGYL